MSHGHRVPLNKCERCGHKLSGAAAADGSKSLAEEGHVSICIQCANVAIYDKDLKLRKPTERELNEILSDETVIKAIWAVKSAQKQLQAKASGDEMEVWCIYDHPTDYPNEYVARLFISARGTGFVPVPTRQGIASKDLAKLREVLDDNGFVRVDRHEMDDPKIIEVWM